MVYCKESLREDDFKNLDYFLKHFIKIIYLFYL